MFMHGKWNADEADFSADIRGKRSVMNDEPARLRALLNFVCKVRGQAGDE
jgi:hypothetical protein